MKSDISTKTNLHCITLELKTKLNMIKTADINNLWPSTDFNINAPSLDIAWHTKVKLCY